MPRFLAQFLLAAVLVLPASPGNAQEVMLDVPNVMQETPVWCWAAVSEQIITWSQGPGRSPPQCALVAMANGAPPTTCCNPNPSCIRTGSMQQIQALLGTFGGRASALAPPTDPMTLFRTLAAGSPVILHVRSGQSSSHVVVLRGMRIVTGPMGPRALLLVNDPMAHYPSAVPFEQLVGVWLEALVVAGRPEAAMMMPGPMSGPMVSGPIVSGPMMPGPMMPGRMMPGPMMPGPTTPTAPFRLW